MIRPGVAEAIKEFWASIDRVTPPPVPQDSSVRGMITEALILALARLNVERDKGKS